jgi:hypothetical protein
MHLRQNFILICFGLFAGLTCGCCSLDRPACEKCPPYLSEVEPLAVAVKPNGAGVTTNFDSVPDYSSAKRSLLSQVAADDSVAITLEEVICLAAKNSELAEVIEQERHLLRCRIDQLSESECDDSSACSCHCPQARGRGIDVVLHGEALEQRNLAAGKAAQAFLGLTQISLQRTLIEESRKRLNELDDTVAAADEAGFATAEGKTTIAKGRFRIDRMESELAAAHQQLTYQLNMLINVGEQEVIVFKPVHDIKPMPIDLDVLAETTLAETNRPGIIATESVISNRCDGEGLYRLLGMFDARIGQQLKTKPVRKLLLRRQLIELIKAAEQPDPTIGHRRSQAEKIVNLRKREARLSAAKAMLDMQTAFEKLAIINADVQRLQKQADLIEAGRKIDATDAYLKLNENWVELQQARSERIEAAIEFEIARVKLQQAQGLLGQSCGYSLACSSCP